MMSNAPKTPLLATADTRILGPWRVRVGFTSREAGNLGLHVDDELGGGMDASMVRTLNHRAALEEALGAGPFFYLNQVHGVEVARPEDYDPASYAPGAPAERTVERARAIAKLAPVADAAVSVEGRPLAIMVADCIPVVLAGSVEGEKTVPVLAVAHAGRRGLLDGVLQTTVARMRELGAAHITAWLGPSICGACYEVPEAMRAESTELIPQVHSVTGANTPGLDLPAGARAVLEAAGVEVSTECARCTYEESSVYSHRGFTNRGEKPGRIAGLVWVEKLAEPAE